MIISSLTCMNSFLETPMFNMDYYFVFSHLLCYHVYHGSNNMWIYILIMFKIYHVDFYHGLILHVLNTCLNVSFIKTRYILVHIVGYK